MTCFCIYNTLGKFLDKAFGIRMIDEKILFQNFLSIQMCSGPKSVANCLKKVCLLGKGVYMEFIL